MKHIFLIIVLLLAVFFAFHALAEGHSLQSTILETEGFAASCNDKPGVKTEDAALLDAEKKAIESALSDIQKQLSSENTAKKALQNAYTKASVRILKVIEAGWTVDSRLGDGYKVKVRAEVIPDEGFVRDAIAVNPGLVDDPTAPLLVRVWTDKPEYKKGDKVKIHIKGNKPFYARVVYRDAAGNLIQVLPNPYRKDDYFLGGVTYELPSNDDRYELAVTPPFGTESAIVYASTMRLGQVDLKDTHTGVYTVQNSLNYVAVKSRGIIIKPKSAGTETTASFPAAEFAEAHTLVKTEN